GVDEVNDNESLTVTLSSQSTYILGSPVTATGTIHDINTTLPTVSISGTPTVDEGGLLSYTVARTGGTSQPLTVFYTTGGQATSGSDYTAPSCSLTIGAGASRSFPTRRSSDLGVDEVNDNESLTVTLS